MLACFWRGYRYSRVGVFDFWGSAMIRKTIVLILFGLAALLIGAGLLLILAPTYIQLIELVLYYVNMGFNTGVGLGFIFAGIVVLAWIYCFDLLND